MHTDTWYQAILIRNRTASTPTSSAKTAAAGFTQLGSMVDHLVRERHRQCPLLVTGSDLKFFVSDVLTIEAFDGLYTTGTVGFRSDNYALIDDFSVRGRHPPRLPFARASRRRRPRNCQRSDQRRRRFSGGREQGVPALVNAQNVETLTGVKIGAVELQADVAGPETSATFATLFACYNVSNGPDNYYVGRRVHAGVNDIQVFMFRKLNGVFVSAVGADRGRRRRYWDDQVPRRGDEADAVMNGVQQTPAIDSTFNSGGRRLACRQCGRS